MAREMSYIILIIFMVINIGMARYESFLRKRDIQNGTTGAIKHWFWACVYIGLCVSAFFISDKNYFLLAALITVRKPVFDISFNLFNGLPAFMVSTTTSSIIDKINNSLFHGNAKLYQSIYAGITIVLIFFF